MAFRRIAVFFQVLLLAAALPARAAPGEPLAGLDLQRITGRGYLMVAMPAADFPPFFLERNGKLMGVDVDMARGLGKSLGVGVRFVRTAQTFDDAVGMVVNGKADIAWCKLSRTMERARAVNFSRPYLSMNHALAINRVRLAEMMRQGTDIAVAVRNYRGTLGVLEGSSWLDYARQNFPGASLVQFKSYDEAVRAVRDGSVSAIYRDNFEIKRLIRNDPTISLTVKTITFTDLEDTIGVAVRPTDLHLLAFINMYIEKQPDRLTVDKLLNHFDPLLK